MKDIPTEELATISAELHEAAVRVGCDFVSVTGKIWPGGQVSGLPQEAARFVEFSWLRAAVVNDRAIFEDADPRAFAVLLNKYGLGGEAYVTPELKPTETQAAAPSGAPPAAETVRLVVDVSAATKDELERQARASGLSIGEFLDWKFRASAIQPTPTGQLEP